MRLVIMQPSYLPWVGYFDLFLKSDLFLVYDNVQYDKEGWRNRNRIKTKDGVQWITVPVLTSGMNKPTNRDIQIDNKEPWRRKHLKSLELNYRKAPYFEAVYPILESIFSQSWDRLFDLNIECLRKICGYLKITTPMQFTSELGLELPEGKNEKLIALCKHFGASEFYEPEGGRNYIEAKQFEEAGIRLSFQDFNHPVYSQLHGPFVSHLSIVDLLFNCGPESIKFIESKSAVTDLS